MSDASKIENHSGSKYIRTVVDPTDGSTCKADVYAVLVAFNVTCPAIAHAVKKLLCAGVRDKGDKVQDLRECRDAISRAIQLQESRERPLTPMEKAPPGVEKQLPRERA